VAGILLVFVYLRVLYSTESVVNGLDTVSFDVFTGAVQYREDCEWLGYCYLWLLTCAVQ
jgi:hypothetical protein